MSADPSMRKSVLAAASAGLLLPLVLTGCGTSTPEEGPTPAPPSPTETGGLGSGLSSAKQDAPDVGAMIGVTEAEVAAVKPKKWVSMANKALKKEGEQPLPAGSTFAGTRFLEGDGRTPGEQASMNLDDFTDWRFVYNVDFDGPGGSDDTHSVTFDFSGPDEKPVFTYIPSYFAGNQTLPENSPTVGLGESITAVDDFRTAQGSAVEQNAYGGFLLRNPLGPRENTDGYWVVEVPNEGVYGYNLDDGSVTPNFDDD